MSFTDQKPFIATKRDCGLRWSGGENGRNFRCYLCGHKFIPGDVVRWVFTNHVKEVGGNPLVCEVCNDTNEKVIEKWKKLIEDFRSDKFWWFRKGENNYE